MPDEHGYFVSVQAPPRVEVPPLARQVHRPRRPSRLSRVIQWVFVLTVTTAAVTAHGLAPNRQTTAPPAGLEEAGQRLAPPARVAGSGEYTFLFVQPDGVTPVTWDPCRPIHYVVRPLNEPPGGAELLQRGFAELSAATGLTFVYDGTTAENPPRVPYEYRMAYQPDRYGKHWAPVLVSWSTRDEEPGFGTAYAGLGGPSVAHVPGRESVLVSGDVILDEESYQELASRGQMQQALDIVLHELGHLAGLDHVQDPDQVMFPRSEMPAQNGYGRGDLAGLARLGDGPCRPYV